LIFSVNLPIAVKEITQKLLWNYTKRRFIGMLFNNLIWALSPIVGLFSNLKGIIYTAKILHSLSFFIIESVEDLSNLSFFTIDIILFDQAILIRKSGRLRDIFKPWF